MAGIAVLILMLILMLLGTPIAVSLSVSTLIGFLVSDVAIPLTVIPQRLVGAIDSFTLLAIPFFMLAGEMMMVGSMSTRLMKVANATVGWMVGGLAQVSTLTCMFFAGISGSGAADTAAVGKMMIPILEKRGYGTGFAASTVATAGTIAIVIPPSIPMIVYGVSSGASISALFTAGILPGILIGVSIMLMNYWICKKNGWDDKSAKFNLGEFSRAIKEGIWALFLPIIIILGIRMGIFTPTESAVIAVAYALFVSMFIYRDLKIPDLPGCFLRSCMSAGMVVFIIAGANLLGWFLTAEMIPQKITALMLMLTQNKYVILFLINILLFIAGCFLNASAAITILTPMLLPLIKSVGIDPVFFGLIMVVNLSIGLITPPVGLDLFIVQGMVDIQFGQLIRGIIPFVIVLVLDLMLITYIPAISMWLPGILK